MMIFVLFQNKRAPFRHSYAALQADLNSRAFMWSILFVVIGRDMEHHAHAFRNASRIFLSLTARQTIVTNDK